MRIWSISPSLLDSKRLNAQWREALLCRKVLEGNTKGYKNHPQFLRVKKHPQPFYFINMFLYYVWEEGNSRGYKYDREKLIEGLGSVYGEPLKPMEVTEEQLEYEFHHNQLKMDSQCDRYKANELLLKESNVIPVNNFLFKVTEGKIEDFEKQKEETLNRIKNGNTR